MIRLVAVILGLALSLGTTTVTAASADAPAWTPGDTWTFHTNTTLGAGLYFDGRATVTVIGHAPARIEGASYDSYTVSVGGEGTASGTLTTRFGSSPASGHWVLTGEQIIEAQGLTVLSSVVDLGANGTLHSQPVSLAFQLSVQNTTTYRVSKNPWHFPLTVGDSAVVQGQLNFTEDVRIFYGFPTTPTHIAGLAWWNVTYTVETQVPVDTPAGRFDSYRIRQAYPDGTYSMSFFAPAAGNDARTETHNQTAEFATADLVAYRYQALEPPKFLGLTTNQWIITVVGVVSAGALASIWWWRSRKQRKPRLSQPGGPRAP